MIAMLSPLAVFIMLFFIFVFCNFSSFFSGGPGAAVVLAGWISGMEIYTVSFNYSTYYLCVIATVLFLYLVNLIS